jgi:glucosamine-6-phosphate deaminase
MMPFKGMGLGHMWSQANEMAVTKNWKLTVTADDAAMSQRAADVIEETIENQPDAVITLPTGATPLQLFDILAARSARMEIDFSRVTFYSLDDYLGLNGEEPNSLTAWLRSTLLDRINLDPARTHLVPAGAQRPVDAAEAYDRQISESGGFDLAVLGIGANGHIAFNEPGSTADSRTRVVSLKPDTVAQASAYWGNTLSIPDKAMTVGIANLLEARKIILLASGSTKAEALKGALEGPISPTLPASFLQQAGARLEVIADEAAAADISHR